jgi:acyl-CoA synthetase (AMP-forming)/AMP-acid ligase II
MESETTRYTPATGTGIHLLDLLEASASGRGTVRFLPEDPTGLTFADLWRRSEGAARWYSARLSEGDTVAAVLSASPACIAGLVGAWRAGLTVASLPTPARAMSPDAYRAQVEANCAAVGAGLLMIDDAYLPLVPPMAIEVLPFGASATGRTRRGRTDASGNFVQFTSGSTGPPRGVYLDLDAIAANVLALLEVLQPRTGDVAVSWLPLSHDMGLVGLCLAPWVATAPSRIGAGTLCLIRTEVFLQRPALWLETCSHFGATFTGGPTFAFDIAGRTLEVARNLDLGRLRACVVGGEPVRAATLRTFADAAKCAAFDSLAFCPAYGLAEATLAVTMVRPSEQWEVRAVDPIALAQGEWLEVDSSAGSEVVSVGRAIPGADVRIEPADATVGEIAVRGASLLSAYVGADLRLDDGGWLRTGDLGCILDAELFVAGRADDLLFVGGRNLYATEIERVAESAGGIRRGNALAVQDDGGRYVLVAELSTGAEPEEVARRVREAVVHQCASGPAAIAFVRKGSLPKTPTGKPQRRMVGALHRAGELDYEAFVPFSRTHG